MDKEDIPRWMLALADEYPWTEPPPGVIANFENPQLVGGHSITIACSVCIPLLLIIAAIRVYAKLRLVGKTAIDDYFFCASVPLLISVLSMFIFIDQAGGYGYHAWDLKIKSLTRPSLTVTIVIIVILPLTMLMIKMTLLCLILTAFRPIHWLRILCYVGLVMNGAYYLSNIIVCTVACHPRGGTDRLSLLAGVASKTCNGRGGMVQKGSLVTGIYNLISDIYVLIIPLPAVARLKIDRRRKLGVYLIFSAGGLACIASALSLVFRFKFYKTRDPTVDAIPVFTTNMIEISVGLMVSCIAPSAKVLRHVLKQYSPKWRRLGGSDSMHLETPATVLPDTRKRMHYPGGLSEIESMQTFRTPGDHETLKGKSLTFLMTASSAKPA